MIHVDVRHITESCIIFSNAYIFWHNICNIIHNKSVWNRTGKYQIQSIGKHYDMQSILPLLLKCIYFTNENTVTEYQPSALQSHSPRY